MMANHVMAIDRELHDIAAGRNKRLIIQMPPRHGKSELSSKFFPAWYLGTFPQRNVILTSATDDLAMDFSVSARDLLNEYGHLFGTQLRSDRSSAQRWGTTEGGGLRAAGVGGAIMGRGADLLIIDDYFRNIEEALSETVRRKMYQWYLTTSRTRLSPTGAQVIIATRWHYNDLIGEVLKTAEATGEEWRVVSFPAIGEDGAALWPEQWPLSLLEPQRKSYYASGYPWMWEALYQQNPPEALDAEWPLEYFADVHFDNWPHPSEQIWRVMALDPSLGKSEKTDYSALVMIALGKDGLVYIDADIDRRDVVKQIDSGIAHCRRFAPNAWGLEIDNYGAIEALCKQRNGSAMPLPLATIRQSKEKIGRIKVGLTPYLANRKLRFKRNSPGVSILLEQLRGFPSHKFDDGPDALEMALRVGRELGAPKMTLPEMVIT